MENYSFVIDGKLAASACPGRRDNLAADLKKMAADGITAIVSLTESCLDMKAVQAAGMTCKHIPVVDFEPPSIDQMKHFCDFVRSYTGEGRGAVLVHCAAGIGRTGTMLSAYFISEGMSANDALRHVRKLRPQSVETPSQLEALRRWEAHNRERKSS